MAAIPADNFKFQIGSISFSIQKQSHEIYPGVEGETVIVEYSLQDGKSEAGVCIR